MIRIEIPGQPVAKARPRVYRVNGITRTVTPENTVRYEQHVRNCAMLAGVKPMDGALIAIITAFFELPKSKHKKTNPVQLQLKTTKPDCDNLAKSVLDALNGIAYSDDSQISILHVYKYTAPQGESPRVIVTIKSVDEPINSVEAHHAESNNP